MTTKRCGRCSASSCANWGSRSTRSATAGSAIERLKANGGYDMLLTDFAMPGMNGLDTIRSAIRQRPAIHALLMTGYADEEARRRRARQRAGDPQADRSRRADAPDLLTAGRPEEVDIPGHGLV